MIANCVYMSLLFSCDACTRTHAQIILHYASGRLRDHHYICGATVDVPGYMLPTQLFEPIGKLLQQQVRHGRQGDQGDVAQQTRMTLHFLLWQVVFVSIL